MNSNLLIVVMLVEFLAYFSMLVIGVFVGLLLVLMFTIKDMINDINGEKK